VNKLVIAALTLLLLLGAGTAASADTQENAIESNSVQLMSDGKPPM
jgi:hypothetical protein